MIEICHNNDNKRLILAGSLVILSAVWCVIQAGASDVLAEERRNRLLELVRLRGFASLPDLAGELQVSESTIRRDLEFLEEDGTAKRTHGGVFYTGSAPKLPHFDERQPASGTRSKPSPAGQPS